MRRRGLLAALGAGALPVSVVAQTAPRRVGVLMMNETLFDAALLRKAMAERGLVEGPGFVVDFRSADGDAGRLDALARELVAAKVDAIVAWQTPPAVAAKRATSAVPIVMAAGDPVGNGLIASLARPGGNVTGIDASTAELGGKRLELLRELLPAARRIGVMTNPPDQFAVPFMRQIEQAATRIGIEIEAVRADDAGALDQAVRSMVERRIDAAIVQPSLPVKRIAELALAHRLPAMSDNRVFAHSGGLLAYGSNLAERYRLVATYLDRIFKGANPADLPVMRPTQFDLLVNLRTAKALGIEVPSAFLQRADEVIE